MVAIIKVIKCKRKDTLNERTFVTAAQSLFRQIIFHTGILTKLTSKSFKFIQGTGY